MEKCIQDQAAQTAALIDLEAAIAEKKCELMNLDLRLWSHLDKDMIRV